jgi:bifunctional UDP-N-acetylglucosamine pyrophosphorylase/glucosamine-1-phosphate N-acetyltransferase
MAFAGKTALKILDAIGNGNSKGEYYLTDAVTIVRELGLRAVVIETSEDEVRGINTKGQLAEAEQVMQRKLRQAALDAGVTLIAPETVFLAADTTFGKDVTIEPFVVIGPGVVIDDGAVIHSFSNIVGARIGNFVETKASEIDAGSKVNHLTYIGDTHIGEKANIGAGTIVCNYDGFDKHRTEIGAGAFVGSNSSLVAPVKIGAGAFIGSGSVITREVPDNSLAVERGEQTVREGWAKRFRDMKMLNRKPKSQK